MINNVIILPEITEIDEAVYVYFSQWTLDVASTIFRHQDRLFELIHVKLATACPFMDYRVRVQERED